MSTNLSTIIYLYIDTRNYYFLTNGCVFFYSILAYFLRIRYMIFGMLDFNREIFIIFNEQRELLIIS